MTESAFEKAFAEEMKGAERRFAVFAWELNNLVTYADLGRHPTPEQVDAELKRLRCDLCEGTGRIERRERWPAHDPGYTMPCPACSEAMTDQR